MMAHVAQLTLPHELEQVADMITVNSAKAARLPDYGIAAGCVADLVVVDAPSVHEAIRLQPVAPTRVQGRPRSRAVDDEAGTAA